jgi:MoxR-like ATPase
MCLQGILEGKPYFFALSGEYVFPAPGFTIIATANTKGKGSDDGRYVGTNVLNEAFLERFAATFEQEFPNLATEKRIVMNWMEAKNCLDEQFADELVKWADSIRKTFDEGAIGELIATRRLEHIVNSYAIFNNKEKAVEMCTARFDTMTTNAFRALFKQIATPAPEPVAVTA